MKKLLITGAAGFIGAHVVESVLRETDWDIVIIDKLTYAGNLNRLTDINSWDGKRVKFIHHDLAAEISETTHKMIGEIDYIWHLAAESHVQRSLDDSIPFIKSNVLGTANLLEYVKKYQPNLQRFITFSTDEVYGPAKEGEFFLEGVAHSPSNPYSASKSGEEAISRAFAYSFGMPITITNTMNVFGERQHPEKFVPMVIQDILSKKRTTIHGTDRDNVSSRCWIHAREVANALLYLNERGEVVSKDHQEDTSWGVYNIVGEERSALDIADMVSEVINNRKLKDSEIEWVDFHKTRPGHDLRYALSGDKLKKMGFNYSYSLEDSFGKMVRWMFQPENLRWLNL